MGVGPKISRSGVSGARVRTEYVYVNAASQQLGNPNPSSYEVVQSVAINGHLLVQIKYPDCTNYEGNKILLYRGLTLKQLLDQKLVDPHFSNSEKYKSPIARFEPTLYGWNLACKIMETFAL